MNQGKLEVVKQEMARVNVDILGISELKWTGMGEFKKGLSNICSNGTHNKNKRKRKNPWEGVLGDESMNECALSANT